MIARRVGDDQIPDLKNYRFVPRFPPVTENFPAACCIHRMLMIEQVPHIALVVPGVTERCLRVSSYRSGSVPEYACRSFTRQQVGRPRFPAECGKGVTNAPGTLTRY